MGESRRLVPELPDAWMVKLTDGSYVPNLQPFAEDGGSAPDVAVPLDVKAIPPWVGEDGVPPEDAAPIPQRKVMGDIIVADAAPERIAPATVPAEYLAATGRSSVRVPANFPQPRRCPACDHLVVDHTSGAAGTGGCAVEGCSCGHGYHAALALATAAAGNRAELQALTEDARAALGLSRARRVVTREEAEKTWPATPTLRDDCELLWEAIRNLEAYAQGVSWEKERWAMQRVQAHCETTPNEWQQHVCRAWARALGIKGLGNAVPTVTALQDATEALQDAERTASHALDNVRAQLDAHRATLVSLTNGGPAPVLEAGQIIEYRPVLDVAPLVRAYFDAYARWSGVISTGDDRELWLVLQEAEKALKAAVGWPEPAAPVAPDPAIAVEDTPKGEAPGEGETDDDIPF